MHLQLCYSVLNNNGEAEQSQLGNVSERVGRMKLRRSLFSFRTFFKFFLQRGCNAGAIFIIIKIISS